MTSRLRGDIQRFAAELGHEDDTAYDLWSRLPSYASAVKHFNDYADEKRPSNADVMTEAAMVFSTLRSRPLELPLNWESWFYIDTDEFEDGLAVTRADKEAFVKAWFEERHPCCYTTTNCGNIHCGCA